MRRIFYPLVLAAMLSGCGQPMIRDGDLVKKLQSLGYTKVMMMQGMLNCGRFGKGKHFIGINSHGGKVIGQICYLKTSRDIEYDVRTNKVISGAAGYGWKNPALADHY